MLYPLQGLAALSGLFGKTRQGWYQWASGLDESVLFDALVAQMAIDIRSEMNNMKLGTSKLLLLINEQLGLQGFHVGRDRLYAILRERGLLVRRRRRRAVTTNSNHLFKRYPNLIKERVLNQPEEVWDYRCLFEENHGILLASDLGCRRASKSVDDGIYSTTLSRP